MGKKIWIAPSRSVHAPTDPLAPVKALVGSLADAFDWVGEVELEDGRTLNAYRHRVTEGILRLDGDGRAWAEDPGRKVRFCEEDIHSALWRVIGYWDDEERHRDFHHDGYWDEYRRRPPEQPGLPRRQKVLVDAAVRFGGQAMPPDGWIAAEAGPDASAVHVDSSLIARARRYVPAGALVTDDTVVEHALSMYAVDRELSDPHHDHYWGLDQADELRLHREDVHHALHGPLSRSALNLPF